MSQFIKLGIVGRAGYFPYNIRTGAITKRRIFEAFQTKIESKWQLKPHSFYLDTATLTIITPKCTINTADMPMVIITNRATESSGDFFIMAFKGRKILLEIGIPTKYIAGNINISKE